MSTVDFYYDVVCPFAYLAFRQLASLRAHTKVRLHPVLLGGLLRHVGGPDDPNKAMAPARSAMNLRDLQRWASLHEVRLRVPEAHPRRSVDAMRVLAAAPSDQLFALSDDLYTAYWEDGLDIADRECLQALVARRGLSLPDLLERGRLALRDATAQAADAGVFGVPTFVGPTRLVWGQDRLGLVLRDLGHPMTPERWLDTPRQPQTREVKRLRFFHDFASPYSYLAATQVERIAAEHGVAVDWTPVLVGGLFRAIGTPDVPLFEMNATKQAYARRDLQDWAEAWGVEFRFPTCFPMRSILPLRAAVVEPRASLAIYRAAWVEDQRVDDAPNLCAVLDGAGFDGAGILARAQDAELKARLRSHGDAAFELGLCGVPSLVLEFHDGEPEVFWGQDRLVMLRAALRGWNPPRSRQG